MGDLDGKNTASCTVSRLLGDRSKGEAGILSSKPISGIQEPPFPRPPKVRRRWGAGLPCPDLRGEPPTGRLRPPPTLVSGPG